MVTQELFVNCTICGSSNIRQMLELNSKAYIVRCENCGNAFTHPKPNIPDYKSEDFQSRNGDTLKLTTLDSLPHEIQVSYNLQVQMVERILPKGSAVLEIGGGEGIFLEMLKNRGYLVELVEPSVSASSRAQKRGLCVYNDYFQSMSFDRKYSLICMSHVLEHMENPLDVLNKVKGLLTPNGFILLAQTNFKGFMPLLLKANWYAWLPEQHFTHFSLSGLKYLANELSLSISDFRYSRLVHGSSIYHRAVRYIPFLQDQIHILLRA